jgi:hypothetical protein
MSNLKYSKAPWGYDDNVGLIYSVKRYAQKEETPKGYECNQWNDVCRMTDYFNYGTRKYDYEKREANACLVSCAPEMLEALIKQYLEFCKPCKKCNPEYANCYSCEDQDELKIIIEKATGLKIEEVIK